MTRTSTNDEIQDALMEFTSHQHIKQKSVQVFCSCENESKVTAVSPYITFTA